MQCLMSLIDKNATLIPEGDYLKMCQLMMTLNQNSKTLTVTPDVVGERAHKWITVSDALRESFIEHEKDPMDKVKLGIYKQIREASKAYWRELTQTHRV